MFKPQRNFKHTPDDGADSEGVATAGKHAVAIIRVACAVVAGVSAAAEAEAIAGAGLVVIVDASAVRGAVRLAGGGCNGEAC